MELKETEHLGYFVDDEGNVWSNKNWRGYGLRKLTPFPNSYGYLAVKVCCNGGMKKAYIHKMVCKAFWGEKPSDTYDVRHLDGNKENNAPNNLCWGTRKENANDRKLHGTEMAAENGRNSAKKLMGPRSPYCMRGHDKKGRKECLICRKMIKNGLI